MLEHFMRVVASAARP